MTPRGRSALDNLADDQFQRSLSLDPIEATFTGVKGYDHLVTDYSPAGHQARAEQRRRTLQALQTAPVVDSVDAVTAAALRERLTQHLAEHEAGLAMASLNNIASPIQALREVFDVAPADTDEDWAAIAARLRALPSALAGYREGLRAAVAGGWRPAARQVGIGAAQAHDFGAPGGFFTGLAVGRQGDVPAAAGQAAAAYFQLADWLTSELGPIARDDDAVGRDVYALAARGFLGTTVDLDETYAWGLEELARIEERMATLADRLARDATGDVTARIGAGIAVLDSDPARTITGASTFRDWMQELSDAAVDHLSGSHFDIAPSLRSLRCRLAPSSSGGVYYTPPSEDLSRPGQMWWAVPEGVTTFSTWRETSTVYHEGVPGHHLQMAGAAHDVEGLNRWRRLGVWVSGHGEGWALYAERLMEELGFLQDPGDLMGMLDAHALRAARVVVDIGVHCRLQAPAEVGGGTWDAAKAWQFLRTHTRVSEPSLRFELDRYLGWPGQAIAYKVGERCWLELRARASAAAGSAFDLKSFHTRALAVGSVGLDVLRDALS